MELDYKNTNPTGEMWQLDTARVYIPAPGGNAGAAVPRSEATTPAGREAKAMLDNLGLVHLFRARRVRAGFKSVGDAGR